MPALATQEARFRASQYQYTGYLGTIPETVIYSRAVNMATITYPVKAITYDDAYSGVGVYSDVAVDMEVLVYAGNTSTLKGRLRVAAGSQSNGTLQVNEFAQGYLDLADNDRIDVVSVWRIHDKLVEASKNFRKDSRTTYSDQGANPNPVANGGGAWFGFIDDGGNYATIAFDGSTSFVVDPDGGSLSYSWSLVDGIVTAGATNTSSVTAQFPPGCRHVILTVTNSGSGKTATKYIPVHVYNRSNHRPLAVQMQDMSYSQETGWSASFSLPRGQESSLTSLPDGAFICYFERESYNGARVSYGSNLSGRSQVKYVGYLVRDSIRINAETDEVTFEAEGPLGILAKTPALPQLIVSKASPTKWSQIKTLTVNRALWYLTWWHASVMAYFDFIWVDGNDLAYKSLTLDNLDNLAGQLRDIADSLNVKLTCDRLGRLLFVRDFNYLDASDRDARTTAYGLTTADIMDIDIPREHRRTTKMVEGRAFTSAGKPLYSRAPGNAPAPDALSSDVLDRQIVADQTELNERTGFHFARLNGTFYDRSTKAISNVPQGVSITLPDSYDVFDPAYNEAITLTLASTTNTRGVSFDTDTRWTIASVSVSYDAEEGSKDIRLTLDHETDGPAGVKYVPPQAGNLSIPPITPIDWNFPAFDLPAITNTFALPGVSNTMSVFLANQTRWGTVDYTTPSIAGGPSYTGFNLGASGSIGNVLSFTVDPYSPLYLGTGSTVNGWLATTTKIYYVTDIHATTPTLTLKHTFAASVSNANLRLIKASIAAQNWVMCASYYDSSGGVKVTYTTDNSTFTEVQITAHYNSGASPVSPTLAVSDVVPGLAYAFAFTATGSRSAATSAIYKTTNYGSSWAVCSGSDPQATNHTHLGNVLHIIGFNNPSQNKILWTKLDSTTIGSATSQTCNALYKSVGSTQTDIAPHIAGVGGTTRPFGAGASRAGFGVHTCRTNGNKIILAGQDRAEDTSFRALLYSPDGGTTWLTRIAAAASGYNDAFIADDGITTHLWGEGGLLAVSGDLGATQDSRVGNSGIADQVIIIAGG